MYHVNSFNNLKFMFTTRHFWDSIVIDQLVIDVSIIFIIIELWEIKWKCGLVMSIVELWNFYFTKKRSLSKLFVRVHHASYFEALLVWLWVCCKFVTLKKKKVSFSFQLLIRRRQIHNVHRLMCVKKWFLFTKKSHPTRCLDTFGQKN